MSDSQRALPYLLLAGMFGAVFAVTAAISRNLARSRRYYAHDVAPEWAGSASTNGVP